MVGDLWCVLQVYYQLVLAKESVNLTQVVMSGIENKTPWYFHTVIFTYQSLFD